MSTRNRKIKNYLILQGSINSRSIPQFFKCHIRYVMVKVVANEGLHLPTTFLSSICLTEKKPNDLCNHNFLILREVIVMKWDQYLRFLYLKMPLKIHNLF